jgi:anti-sigma B factor antagonist
VSEEDEQVPNDEQERAEPPSAGPSTAGQTTRAELSIDDRAMGERTVVAVRGEVDLYTAPTLREHVLRFADRNGSVVIDLSDVPFMDSSGLGAIVGCLKRLRESGGDLVLVALPGSPPSKLLSLTGLDRAIPTFSSVDEALG